MKQKLIVDLPNYEALLAAHVAGFANEIRQHNVEDLIAFVRLQKNETVRSLLESIGELYFKPKTNRFVDDTELLMGWTMPPRISFSMKFENRSIEVFYRIIVCADTAAVNIDYMQSEDANGNGDVALTKFQCALESARI
ncbi:MAG: hypothetical protein AAF732_07170 [Pseudomonadota bacterium]